MEIVEGMRQADGGTVEVFGQSPWPRNMALLRRIGVQTQASAFFTRLTAREHLETVAVLQGLDRGAAHRRAGAGGPGGQGAAPGSTTCRAASGSGSRWPPPWCTSRT